MGILVILAAIAVLFVALIVANGRRERRRTDVSWNGIHGAHGYQQASDSVLGDGMANNGDSGS